MIVRRRVAPIGRPAVTAALLLALSGAGLAAGAAPAGAHGAGVPELRVSSSAGRAPSTPLSGATVAGSAYVFVAGETDVRRVEFWLDQPVTAPPRQVESFAPYDLAGGSDTAAAPLDTRQLSEGAHAVTFRVTSTDGHQQTETTGFVVDNVPGTAPPPTATRSTLRINTGGAGLTTGGTTWQPDTYAVGGVAFDNPRVTSVAGTADDALYRNERSTSVDRGSFSYRIPAPAAGTYTVRLHFAEIYFGVPGGGPAGAGRRVFSANLEGGAVELVDYDLFADVGAATATVKTFTLPVTDGTLDIDFTARANRPTVAAIEVVFPTSSTPPPGPALDTPFSWESRAAAPIGRSEGQGAVVGGRLYVFGGFSVGLTTTARSDVYDPATGVWSRLPDMPEQLTHSTAVVDGSRIWLVGGYVGNHPGPSTTSVWVFDTATRSWARGPSLPQARGAGAASLLGRQLHFFGGSTRISGVTTDRPEHWSLDLDGGTTWQRRADFPTPRNHLASATVGGSLFAFGGQFTEDEANGLQARVDRYDLATGRWQRVADLPRARSHTVAVVQDGRVLLIGGTDPGGAPSADATWYDPATDAWARMTSLPGARKSPVAGLVGGTVLVSGGSNATSTFAGRTADRWETGPVMPVALGEVAGGVIGRTHYLVGEGSSATLALDLPTGTWRRDLAVRPLPGNHHAAEVLGGKLYLLGGLGAGAGRMQVYDPAANSWSLGPDLPFAAGSSASAVVNGRILVAGGIVDGRTTTRAASFDPVTRAWTELPPMPQGRNHAAAGTDGRRLLVFGGRGLGSGDSNMVANGFATTQAFDPATGRWTSSDTPGAGLAPLPQARGGTGRAVLHRGELYVLGGETATGAGATSRGVYQRVDVYDPVRNTWRLATPMPTARHGIFPVLHAGRIVVAGGGVQAGGSASTVVETYTEVP